MQIVLVRHGETEWSRSGRHTGRTDVELTALGRTQAVSAGAVVRTLLGGRAPRVTISSPRMRALQTAELAGHPGAAVDERVAEWDYGEYEGLTTAEIRQRDPGWSIWTGAVPAGESAAQVAARMDSLLSELGDDPGPILIFSHGHASRCLAARWLGEPISSGGFFALGTGAVCALGREHHTPVVTHWNVDAALAAARR
jgi:broad specificity phosphatase PhoE